MNSTNWLFGVIVLGFVIATFECIFLFKKGIGIVILCSLLLQGMLFTLGLSHRGELLDKETYVFTDLFCWQQLPVVAGILLVYWGMHALYEWVEKRSL